MLACLGAGAYLYFAWAQSEGYREFPKNPIYDFCYQGEGIEAVDGDTIHLKSLAVPKLNKKIRLLGIDAPESAQAPWGEQAKQELTALIDPNQGICCKKGAEALDKYDRLLAHCWSGNYFLNRELVARGRAYSYFIGEKNSGHRFEFEFAEAIAEKSALGVHHPQTGLTQLPVEYRAQHKHRAKDKPKKR